MAIQSKAKIPFALERDIKQKAHSMSFAFIQDVEDELRRKARIMLLEGKDVIDIQKYLREL